MLARMGHLDAEVFIRETHEASSNWRRVAFENKVWCRNHPLPLRPEDYRNGKPLSDCAECRQMLS